MTTTHTPGWYMTPLGVFYYIDAQGGAWREAGTELEPCDSLPDTCYAATEAEVTDVLLSDAASIANTPPITLRYEASWDLSTIPHATLYAEVVRRRVSAAAKKRRNVKPCPRCGAKLNRRERYAGCACGQRWHRKTDTPIWRSTPNSTDSKESQP